MIAPDLKEYVQMIREGQARSVLEQLGPVVSSNPTHVAVHAVLAMANDAEGHLDEAVAAWRRAHALIPDSPAVAEGLRLSLRRRLLARIDERLEETAHMLIGVGAPADGSAVDASAVEEPPVEEPPVEEPGEVEVDESAPIEAVDALADELAAEMIPPDIAESSVSEAVAEPAEPEIPITAAGAREPGSPVLDSATGQDAPVAEAAPDSSGEGLDELIRELETARIVPDPTVRPIEASSIEPDVEDVVSETLAKIYSNQRFYDEAARVYDKLAAQQPARADEFRRKAEEIRSRGQR